jgi:hypothetical protein
MSQILTSVLGLSASASLPLLNASVEGDVSAQSNVVVSTPLEGVPAIIDTTLPVGALVNGVVDLLDSTVGNLQTVVSGVLNSASDLLGGDLVGGDLLAPVTDLLGGDLLGGDLLAPVTDLLGGDLLGGDLLAPVTGLVDGVLGGENGLLSCLLGGVAA